MSNISVREMIPILRQYTILPGVVPLSLREIANAIVADDVGMAFPFPSVSCRHYSPALGYCRLSVIPRQTTKGLAGLQIS